MLSRKEYLLRFSSILFYLTATLSIAAQLDGPKHITAQEIIQRYIAARGGLDKIKAVRSMVFYGPPRPDGKPPRMMMKARPYYFTIGTEGNDGSPWEAYDKFGLRARVTDAPGAALQHTAFFDDPLIMSLDSGWSVELTGSELINGIDTYRLRVIYPDGWVNELFVDKKTWLLVGRRFTAPIHAFGEAVTTQTLVSDYRELGGALFPLRFDEYYLDTGELLSGGGWDRVEANVDLPPGAFAPPPVPDNPTAWLVNTIFRSRMNPTIALGWYHDFQQNPATAKVDIEGAIESVAYHCLKNGGTATGVALLEENMKLHPSSATALFGLGRGYRAESREEEATKLFTASLKLDPNFQPAKDALASKRLKY